MDTDLESFIESPPNEAELRAEVRASTWYYVALTALVSLVAGVLIGRFGQHSVPQPMVAQVEPWSDEEVACAPQASADTIETSEPTATPPALNVYVSGAVSKPQVITVPAGSLVADALDAIGGVATDADLDAVNLAAPLADHQQILIPGKTEVCPTLESESDSAVASVPAATEKIDLNTATKENLETLTGIGSSRAQDIVAYREANGPFQHIEEIQYVSGIGEGIFAQIEPYITVGD